MSARAVGPFGFVSSTRTRSFVCMLTVPTPASSRTRLLHQTGRSLPEQRRRIYPLSMGGLNNCASSQSGSTDVADCNGTSFGAGWNMAGASENICAKLAEALTGAGEATAATSARRHSADFLPYGEIKFCSARCARFVSAIRSFRLVLLPTATPLHAKLPISSNILPCVIKNFKDLFFFSIL